ncbi:hypothetical protein B7463_g1122, partial [Scytalidium lignicola]
MGSVSQDLRHVDVLIVGGGPVGLITAYQLAKFGGVSVAIIEKHPKSAQDQYGRAITLYPRSSEMLDQLDLADELAQECFACRSTVSYDPNGKEVSGRGWHFMENMTDTYWGFALVLRQKYQEEIFRRKLREYGVGLETPVELTDIAIDESVALGEHRITAKLKDRTTGIESVIKCRYLVGADGGRSFVRRALDIPFDGSTTEDKWVRIDGIVETDMPKTRCYGAIESPTHGNVLWAALDRGATRIGFAFTAERQRAYKEFDEEAAVAEAIASLRPFNLKFKEVHWYTVYSVGQKVARHFFTKDCVFLVGDACHTHSSGAAQGMNTGIHDAVNLAWKLHFVLRGKAPRSLLQTYEMERLPNVQKLINYDKDISRLMTMQLPLGWTGNPKADPNEILGVVMKEASTFTSGLSIAFESNMLNVAGSLANASSPVIPGQRGPDVELQKPGTLEATRLHKQTPNKGTFYIVVFTGDPETTSSALKSLSAGISESKYFSNLQFPISWLTIPAKAGPSAYELLDTTPFGKVFYDQKQTAHARYGVNITEGGIVVLRPDGWWPARFKMFTNPRENDPTSFKLHLVNARLTEMAPALQQVFIDGSFQELAQELAGYLNIGPEIEPLLAENKKDEALKKLVMASTALNSAPEKEFTAAYNLLVYLVIQSPSVNMFLPRICDHLSKPITSSPVNGAGLALSVLTTVFNLIQPENEVRFNIFQAILRLIKSTGMWDTLKPQLGQLDKWIAEWDIDEEDQRKLFTQIADVAEDSGEEEGSYNYLLKALRTFDPKEAAEEISSPEAQDLSLKALKIALLSNTHYDFSDLTSLPTIQALSESHPVFFELLEIFSEKELEDYNDFRDENEEFFEESGLDNSKLHRKMRLLTMASLAASTNTRELEYKRIAKALQVPLEDVEMWVIDVIRAGLIEGKLSQKNQVFLVHRTTYRVFGEKQWREVATRLDQWKTSLRGVLDVVKHEREQAEIQKQREQQEADRKIAGAAGMGTGRRVGREKDMVEVGTD